MRKRLWTVAGLLVVLGGLAGCAATSSGLQAISSNTPAVTTEEIQTDPEIREFTLENGLTVYLRANDRPGLSAEMRLAVNAGSAQESADQAGTAHFLEHMLFNGTTQYPKNKLIDTLREFGMEFGADVNAYTSFDETVYQLTVPLDNQANLEVGVSILAEWLGEATLDDEQVIGERGVVLDEWRQSDQTFEGRQYKASEQMYLAGSAYEGRSPIGNDTAISAMTTEPVRRFYDDWYRPDNAAVIIVGDFDLDAVDLLVRQAFDPVAPRATAPQRPELSIGPFDSPRATVLLDPDAQLGYAEVALPAQSVKHDKINLFSTAELRESVVDGLALEMISTRLADDVTRGGVSFTSAGQTDDSFVRPLFAPAVYVSSTPDGLRASTDALLEELFRAARDGFDSSEFERALRGRRSNLEDTYQRRATQADGDFAEGLIDYFLIGNALPDAESYRTTFTAIYDSVSVAEISAAFSEKWNNSAPYVFVSAPDAMPDPPTTDGLLASLLDLSKRDIPTRTFDTVVVDQLMTSPAPVAETTEIQLARGPLLEPTQLTFPNGAIVILNQTDIANDSVAFDSWSPGGLSLVEDSDVWAAQAATSVVAQSGLGELTALQVRDLLASSSVDMYPYVDQTREGFTGTSSSADLEQLFQSVYLMMTDPHADRAALEQWVSSIQPFVDDPLGDPDQAGYNALSDARYGSEIRFAALPTVEMLGAIDLTSIERVFRERFTNASDWVFAVSGDFDVDTVTDLARRYIGTLPSTGAKETFVDKQPDPPAGGTTREVKAGTGAKGTLLMLYAGELNDAQLDPILSDLLTVVITNRLTDDVRERLGASYSPQAYVSPSTEPDPTIETFIQVSGDPQGLQELSTVVRALLSEIGATGPSLQQFNDAVADVSNQYDYYSNEQLAGVLLTAIDEKPNYQWFVDRSETLLRLTPADLAAFAARAISANYVEVQVGPA